MRLLSTLLLPLLASPLLAADLGGKIKPIAEAHKGKIGVMVKNLETGETFELNADEVMQTASLIKMAIMVEAYRQSDDKKVDLGKMLTLTKEDKVQGSGILTDQFSVGASFCLRDAIRLMMRYSDNTATNMVLDQIGIKNVNDTTAKLGIPETRINAKVFKGSTTSVDPERTKKYSLGSTSARESVKLIEMIFTNKVASEESCKAMIAHLKANSDKDVILRSLPEGTVVAHKGGATNQVRTEVGILYIPAPTDKDKKKTIPVALCVLTNENKDQRWIKDNEGQVTIGNISKAVYDHYLPKK